MLQDNISQACTAINSADSLKILEEIRIRFFGKNSVISLESRKLGSLDETGKKELGKAINDAKTCIIEAFEAKYIELKRLERSAQFEMEKIDLTMPARKIKQGSIHPVSQATAELLEIFVCMGCDVKDGPSIDDDWHNFTALNIPENHPARQMHDTFYLQDGKLLRTHTSTVQVRSMKSSKPPFRFVAPGRTYRCDSDATHTPMFHQIEALVVDKNINMGHLKHFVTKFVKQFFEQDSIEVRFRPSFFPFTEPSAEVDVRMNPNDKWLELGGCGMVHPNLLRNCDVDPEEYGGFAIGFGIDRFAMLKYGAADLRQFFEGDKRWVDHYNFSAFDVPSFAAGLTR